MIPKIIHYCWFGRGEKPKLAERCIKSWKKYCPDYKLIEWNEDNFDINCNTYVKEAYEAKKYAFVTDYVRLYVMFNYGGIYMDTDVEVLQSLDKYLEHQAFSGFEEAAHIPTGLMACEKEFSLFGEFLHYYDDIRFINEDGTLNMQTNTITMTKICLEHGLIQNGKFQIIDGFALYPKEVFCPLDNATGKLYKTANTSTIHWYAKSWTTKKQRFISKLTRPFHRIFGKDCFHWLKRRK